MPEVAWMIGHARKRLVERAKLRHEEGLEIINKFGVLIPGFSSRRWRSWGKYYLVYNKRDDVFFVAVVDPEKNAVITILPEETVKISVSKKIQDEARAKTEVDETPIVEVKVRKLVVEEVRPKAKPEIHNTKPSTIVFYCQLIGPRMHDGNEPVLTKRVGTASARTYNHDPRKALKNKRIREEVRLRCRSALAERPNGWWVAFLYARLGTNGPIIELELIAD
ncbi:MAG TPA: hypothetical protein VJJ22_02395 [Candidatus Paceibacterota bacterium]